MTVGVLTVAAAALVAAGSPPQAKSVPPCTGSALTGTFRVVPGSPGAGNIVYELRVRDRSHASCFVSGVPSLSLLDARGHAQATHARGVPAGQLTAVIVRLAPGGAAKLTARFSPDVPGPGEPVGKTCEPKSYKLRVTPNGGGSLVAPIQPPIPVCEHGALAVTVFTAG